MVSGSGMNGRSREARSGGQPVKKHSPSHGQKQVHKPTASAEAIQMARILEDSKQTSEINTKVHKVLSVVPGCSEEQVHLALHDNGFDLDKTISALLDSDGQASQGEWTTTSNRKARKKVTSTESEEPSHKAGVGRSNRATSNSTRDNYGGSVTVHSGSTGRNRTQGGRTKGQSTNRRPRQGGATGDQRRGRTRDKERSLGMAPSVSTSAPVAANEEWDSVNEIPQATDTNAVTSTAGNLTDTWRTLDVWPTPITDGEDTKYWEPAPRTHLDSVQHEIETQPHHVFPEAIPGQERLLGEYPALAGDEVQQHPPHSTPSEITPSLSHTGGSDRDTRQASLDSREKMTRKPKRLARSQIPTKPVEMPGGIDSLDVQFGELGIDFIGLESPPSPPPPPKASTDIPVGSILQYSDLQPRFGDSSVSVSVSTSSTSTALGTEPVLPVENSACLPSPEVPVERETPSSGGLRSPPGLPHPSTSTNDQPQVQQAQVETTPTLSSDVPGSQKSSTDGQLRLEDVPASSGVMKTMTIDLNVPMELPSKTPQTATIEVMTQQPSYTSSVSNASSVFSSSSNVATPASVSHLSSTSSSRSATAGHLSSQHGQQHVTQQGKPGTGNVPPGMLYPHMLPAQYPFIPAPAMYNYDPSDMSRYSSGSMAYFPTSTDPSMGGAMPSRDHTSSSYQASSDHTKFPRGGADIGSAVSVTSAPQNQQGSSLQQQQQASGAAGQQPASGQQMGPPFMGAPFYGSMFYPTMYGPMPAFSQAANFGMTYEDVVAAQTTHDYTKQLYASGAGSSLSKPSSLPVSSSAGLESAGLAGSAGSTSFKHLESGKSYNYSVPPGVGGSQAPGYYMQVPHFTPMMVGPAGAGDIGAMSTPHSRITQQKHSNKVGGYQGNSGGSYWGSTTANHSS